MKISFFLCASFAFVVSCGDAAPPGPGGSSGTNSSSGGGTASSSSGGMSSGGVVVNTPLGTPVNGIATFYNATGGGSCSFPESPGDLDVVAMGAPSYNNAAYCGACLDVTGVRGTVRVRVVDKCPECAANALDMSESAFAKVANPVDGRVPITWTLVRCDAKGPIKYQIKDGASKYWTAVQVRNHTLPIERVEIEKAGKFENAGRVDYNYFILQNGVLTDGAFKVRVFALGGKMLEDTIPAATPMAISDGLKNFD
jgi:expansin